MKKFTWPFTGTRVRDRRCLDCRGTIARADAATQQVFLDGIGYLALDWCPGCLQRRPGMQANVPAPG